MPEMLIQWMKDQSHSYLYPNPSISMVSLKDITWKIFYENEFPNLLEEEIAKEYEWDFFLTRRFKIVFDAEKNNICCNVRKQRAEAKAEANKGKQKDK